MKIDLKAEKIVEQILGRGIGWFDYKKQDQGSWQNYLNDALFIAKSEVFNNELDHYITDLIRFCATMEGTPLSTDKLITLTNVQFGIVVLETFKQRLLSIEEPKKEKVSEDPNSPI